MIADGTYRVIPGTVTNDADAVELENYGEKWNYGFFVANGNRGIKLGHGVENEPAVSVIALFNEVYGIGPLVGVWTDPDTGICYVDPVTHVSDYETAVNLGREYGELAIWDAFKGEEVYL